MSNNRILMFHHSRFEELGLLGDALKAHGFELENRHTHRGDALPPYPEKYTGIILMGGPVGVYDNLPFITGEMRYIEKLLARPDHPPVFGICLGAQMLAQIHGVKVEKGAKGPETGFTGLEILEEDRVFGNELADAKVFQWHQDVWPLPKVGTNLARNNVYENQAHSYSKTIYGVQFHPEVTMPIIRRWHADALNRGQLSANTPDMSTIAADMAANQPLLSAWMHRFTKTLFKG